MSKIFYDHLIVFQEIDLEIKRNIQRSEDREELWKIVDEIIHHHVLVCILDKLPDKDHSDFLEKFHSSPHDTGLIVDLNKKTGEDIEKIIQERMKILEKELIKEIRGR
jgi:hypothetical protein